MDDALQEAVGAALGAPISRPRAVRGGDINDAWVVYCKDTRVFVKSRKDAPPKTFVAEADGLRWLARAHALRIPEVLACGEDPPFLALEFFEPARPGRHHDEALGRGLATLHRTAPPSFGLESSNFIARLPQDNEPSDNWSSFYWERRLQPLVRRATDDGLLDESMGRDFERLAAVLPERCGPEEPPARLHGDLWSGNLLTDDQGGPVLVDPAVYGGHREVDLAMMRLFGGFGPRVFAAYKQAWPLAPEWERRVPLYQLYPLLVHVNLFGMSYMSGLRRALDRVL